MNPYLTPESEIMDLCLEITHISYLGSIVSGTERRGKKMTFKSGFIIQVKA